MYSKFDSMLDFLVERWGWTWFKQDDKCWRKRYPKIVKKIDKLEQEIRNLKRRIL